MEGNFHVASSALLDDAQKAIIAQKLENRINSEGFLQVRSQTHRTQLANKEEVVEKMNELVQRALQKQKKRIATRPSKASKQKKADAKIKNAQKKESRQKIRITGF